MPEPYPMNPQSVVFPEVSPVTVVIHGEHKVTLAWYACIQDAKEQFPKAINWVETERGIWHAKDR